MTILQAHFFAIMTPMLAALSQIIIKWQVGLIGQAPIGFAAKLWFLLELLFRPWVVLAITATFVSGLTWILAMSKLELSQAYPYVASTFVIVPLFGILLFGEHLNTGKIIGSVLIITGIAVTMLKGS